MEGKGILWVIETKDGMGGIIILLCIIILSMSKNKIKRKKYNSLSVKS